MEAVILAGGLGTRLRSVVGEVPKCMAPVGGKPFLHYLMEQLRSAGVTHLVLSVGYLREQVMDWVDAGSWPFAITYAVEETPLGTGGGIRRALSLCREEKVLVLNGDTFFQVDFAALHAGTAPITLALKPMQFPDRYGTVELRQGKVLSFREKNGSEGGLINGGVYLLDRSRLRLDALPERFSFEKEVLEPAAASGEVAGMVQDGYFIDIGVPADYARADRELPELEAVLRVAEAVAREDADTLLLDRDGVINRLIPGDYVRKWAQFRFMPGILGCLRTWAGRFRHILVVTNQRGVGRGLMRPEDLEEIHRRMCAEIGQAGGRIDRIYACTSADPDDPCRKPNTGLFDQACADFPDIRPERCLMVGDAESDGEFARRCGIRWLFLQ